jgi:drug/metabolite transporter (DMT)-like permease
LIETLSARIAVLPPNVRGIFLMILSAASYAVMLALIRGLSREIHFTEIVFFRVGFGLLVMLPMFAKGGVRSMKTTRIWRYSYRAAMQAVAMACYYGGLALLPLAAGVALGQTTAIFLAVIAIWFLGEPSVLGRWISVALGLGGALVIIDPSFEGLHWGAVLVVLSSVIYAIYQVDAKILSRTEPVTLIVFWTMAVATPMALAVALFFWTWPSWEQLGLLFVMGVAGTLGNWFMTQAYKIGEMTALAPAAYSQLVWAAIIGFIVYREIPDASVWIGAAMIIAAGVLLSRLEARRANAS